LIHQAIVQTAGGFQVRAFLPQALQKLLSGLINEGDARQIHNDRLLSVLGDLSPTVVQFLDPWPGEPSFNNQCDQVSILTGRDFQHVLFSLCSGFGKRRPSTGCADLSM
jgi:hypothetical protein